jgi:homoserine kinase type II
MTKTYTYIVQHVHKLHGGSEDVKFIGVYSSELDARRAISRLRDAPGFRDHPDGFAVDRYELNKDHWAEGFVTS